MICNISDRALDFVASRLVVLKLKREVWKKNSKFNVEEYGSDPLKLIEKDIAMYEHLYNLVKDDRKRNK